MGKVAGMNNYMYSITLQKLDKNTNQYLETIYGVTTDLMNKGQVYKFLCKHIQPRYDLKVWKCIVCVVGRVTHAI